MAARGHQLCWLLCLASVLLSRAAGQTACSPRNRAKDLNACLEGIRKAMVDKDRFWFGSDYFGRCPPDTRHTIDCHSRLSQTEPESIASLLFWPGTFDASTIDRYLDIVYTSQKGSYIGCSHNFQQDQVLTFPPVDPLSSDTLSAWDSRGLPALTWDTDANKQYTLTMQTVGVGIVHAIYINIPGNDLSKATALDPYHGPLNAHMFPYIYSFMIYEQQNNDMQIPDFQVPPTSNPRVNFNESDFKATQNLKGPVAASWIQVTADTYSAWQAMAWGSENCSPFITEALKKENLLFLRHSDLEAPLPAFTQVSITNEPLDVTYCCKTTSYPSKTNFLDPFENRNLPNAEVRTGSEVVVNITYNKLNPNITADFMGAYLTVLCVNPDVHNANVGSRTLPLLHWLHIDAQVAADGTLVNGKDMFPYTGPMSPEYGKPHGYYFLVFLQKDKLGSVDPADYTGNNCSERTKLRCLFHVQEFRLDYELALLAVTWEKAINDDYVNMTNKVPESEACAGRSEYADPCPTSGVTVMSSLNMVWLTAALIVYRGLHRAA